MSLKSKIYEYVKSQYPQVVHKGEIGKKAILEWGYENENAGRRCRELEEAGKIEAIYKNGQVGYKWISGIREPYKRPKEIIADDLDEQLRTMLDGTTVSWENQDKFKEIQEALKSGNEYRKRAVIEKYKSPPC
jgi:hypothetical protein